MVSKNQADWLPSGWKLQIKEKSSRKYKCFIDPSTGSKFYSKPEVFRYLQSIQNSAGPSRQEEGRSTRHSSRNGSVDRLKVQESKVEPNASHSSKTRSSGRLFSVKEEVVVENTVDSRTPSTRRLSLRNKEVVIWNTLDSKTPANRRTSSENKKIAVENMVDSKTPACRGLSSGGTEVVIEKSVDKDLPSGWIKEMRKKFNGTKVRKDPFYFHPASGLVFRSKLEVLRYLETGEISRHAYRRRSNVDTKGSTIEKTSPKSSVKRETTTNCNTKKELLLADKSSKGSPSLLPEARVAKENTVRRITRSSSSFLGEESSKGSPLLTPEARVAKEDTVRRITRSSSSFFPGEESIKGSPSLSPETTVAKECTVRRITRSSSSFIPGEESSKGSPSLTPEARVAKEGTIEKITRSSSRVRPSSVCEAKPDPSSLSEGTPKRKTKDQKMLPSTSSVNKSIVESTVIVTMKGCSNKKTQTTKRKTNDQKTTTMPSRSSKRVAGIDAHPVFFSIPIEHTLRKNFIRERHNTLDASPVTVLPTQEEPGNTSDNLMETALPVSSENEVIDVPPINTELSSENPMDHSILEDQPDPLSVSNTEEALPSCRVPPAHSTLEGQRDPLFESKTEKSLPSCPVPTDHSILEGKRDPLLGSKTEKSLPGCSVPEGPQGTSTEPSVSEFSFPPPLWSDPCLEFAYKTLTGAIPLDDNLAIEDYIQHQLRTSKQHDEFQNLPDIDMPSFLQKDETTQVPSLPESTVKLPNSNGLTPPKTQQVKN